MGNPGGLSEVSLKNKVWNSKKEGVFIDARQQQILFDLNMKSKESTFGLAKNLLALKKNCYLICLNVCSHTVGILCPQTSSTLKRPWEREPACLPYSSQLSTSPHRASHCLKLKIRSAYSVYGSYPTFGMWSLLITLSC